MPGNHLAERDKIIRKVKGALSYPIFVVAFVVVMVAEEDDRINIAHLLQCVS